MKFYTDRENNGKVNVPVPHPAEAFWKGIWSTAHEHWSSAEWMRSMSETFEDLEQKEDVRITPDIFKRALGRMRPWKTQGPGAVQVYWVKQYVKN